VATEKVQSIRGGVWIVPETWDVGATVSFNIEHIITICLANTEQMLINP